MRVRGRFIIQSEIEHSNLDGAGSYSHAQIDSHLVSTSNPHNVTAEQVGSASALWNANKIQGRSVSATAPTTGQVLVWNGTAWVPTAQSGSGGTPPIEIPLNRFGDSFFTRTAAYTSASQFIFRGSTALGAPASVRFISWADSGSNYSIRLVDLTNNVTVAELIGLTNASAAIQNITSLSNVPTGEAILEAQIKLNSGPSGAFAFMSFVGVYF